MAYSSASELEKLVSNCEFENQQYVKLIEHEDQLIESLQREIECKEGETRRLQEAVSQLDVDSKQCYKQYTINRDNVDSLKKTNHVLTEHVAAMNSKMDVLDAKLQAERKEHGQHLQRYKDIWDSYYRQYESLPLAQELKYQRMMTQNISNQNQEKEHQIESTKHTIQHLQDNSALCRMGTNGFIVELAKLRVSTLHIMHEAEVKRRELAQLQQILQENLNADRNNETNVQKLTDMHLGDKENTEAEMVSKCSTEQEKPLEIESPMISMLGERDDGIETIQTDPVSPDQINIQLMDGHVTNQHGVIASQQKTVGTDTSVGQNSHVSGEANSTNETVSSSGKIQLDGPHHMIEESSSHPEVSVQETGHSESGPNYSHACVATGVLQTTSQNRATEAQHPMPSVQVQLPFVSYKALGQDSVQIHMDIPVTSVQKEIQGTGMHSQTSPMTINQTTFQRPNIMVGNERPDYRAQIPQIKPPALPRPSYLQTRPTVIQVKPPTLHIPSNRTGGIMANGSNLRQPELPGINKPVQRQDCFLPRQGGGHSRLPRLQVPRQSTVQLEQQSHVLRPNRVHDTTDFGKTAQVVVPSSPLQLSSPPVVYSSPSTRYQSPLQLPTGYQNQMLQQKAKTSTYSPTCSVESVKTQFNPVQHTSPLTIGQRYAPKIPSPLALTANPSPPKVIPAPVQQTWSSIAVSKPSVSVQDSPNASEKMTDLEVGMEITQPDVIREVTQPDGEQGMEVIEPDLPNDSHTSIEADMENCSQTDIKMVQSDGSKTYYMKVKDASEESNKPSPKSSPDELVKTPEKQKGRRLAEESFSPFDCEKHRKKLADMKKSPGQPDNLYKIPAKRVFTEMEGGTTNLEPKSDTVQLPVFGQITAGNSVVKPLDGSGDHTNASATGQEKDSLGGETSNALTREAESAFKFFDSFTNQTGVSASKSPVNIFSFGGGDACRNESSPFSFFGASNDDDSMSGGFSFGFGSSTAKQGEQSTNNAGGSFLSLFGQDGNEDQSSQNTGFTFNFGSNDPKSPAFSFF